MIKYFCDKCNKETDETNRINYKVSDITLSVLLCKKCYRGFLDQYHVFGWIRESNTVRNVDKETMMSKDNNDYVLGKVRQNLESI